MEQWTRRDALKLGVLTAAGFAAPRWAYASTERNLALNRAAWASSSGDFIRTAHMATDGQETTQWCSANADPQWIYVDLGAVCSVKSITLRWGKNYPLSYAVQVSSEPGASLETGRVENWKNVIFKEEGKGGVEQIPLSGMEAKYVRLLLNERALPGGYELSSFEVYGVGGYEPKPTPNPPPEPDGALRLSGGWRLVNQAYVQDEAPAISRLGYDDSKWLIATVPGTILASYLNLGAIPDPFYGNDQLQVSDFFAHANWWYRNEVVIPNSFKDKRIWLRFDGINYRAFVYVNGVPVGNIDGAFVRGQFDLSDLVSAGEKNCIAVLVMPVPRPDKVNVRTLANYTYPAEYPKNEPTYLAAASWDWLPTIRDRDTGIVNHVMLTATGDVTIANPFVTTHFHSLQDFRHADVEIKLGLTNHSKQTCKGELRATLGEVACVESLSLNAGETREILLDKQHFPQLSLVNPRLWWPNGYGEQNLYNLVLEFKHDGLSHVNRSRVGIREYTYNQPSLTRWNMDSLANGEGATQEKDERPLIISCNGRPIFVRGVDWGMDEGMLRCDRRGFDDRLRMEKQMNFNLIRNWAGNVDKPEFFELCDELGLMIWEEFGIANGIMPEDPNMWLANAHDRFLRRRNHACIVLWCSANETIPKEPMVTEMSRMAETLDGTRLFLQCSTQTPPTNGDGPYVPMPPSYYFKELAHGFRPELGSPTIPCVESMRRMMPHNKLWPVSEMWAVHDWLLGMVGAEESGTRRLTEAALQLERWQRASHSMEGNTCGRTESAIAAYGVPTSIEDCCRKAQMVNMEVFKAIYESWNDHMWNDCTGVMIWMSNPAWPSLTWNTYDYYMEPTAAYFACRTACEPVHIQWNIVSNMIKIVNCTLNDLKGLNAQAEVYNLDGSLAVKKTGSLDSPSNSASDWLKLFTEAEDQAHSNMHFIKLSLSDVNGVPLSNNFYWNSMKEWQYEGLQDLPKVRLRGTVGELKGGHISVNIENPTASIAVMVRLKLLDLKTKLLISPVLYSDNYFSLTPHESRRIGINIGPRHSMGHSAALIVEGWNIIPLELTRFSL